MQGSVDTPCHQDFSSPALNLSSLLPTSRKREKWRLRLEILLLAAAIRVSKVLSRRTLQGFWQWAQGYQWEHGSVLESDSIPSPGANPSSWTVWRLSINLWECLSTMSSPRGRKGAESRALWDSGGSMCPLSLYTYEKWNAPKFQEVLFWSASAASATFQWAVQLALWSFSKVFQMFHLLLLSAPIELFSNIAVSISIIL